MGMPDMLKPIGNYIKREVVWLDRAHGITKEDPYKVVPAKGYHPEDRQTVLLRQVQTSFKAARMNLK